MEGKKRIVVVEDELAISKLISYVLENAGFAVNVEFDGANALESILNSPPDLVLLDLMLPSMSGFEILSKLRTDDKTMTLPVIVLTCRGQEDDKEHAFRLGVTDYVTKPFSPTSLVAILRSVLATKGIAN